jgi:hypothetical protein
MSCEEEAMFRVSSASIFRLALLASALAIAPVSFQPTVFCFGATDAFAHPGGGHGNGHARDGDVDGDPAGAPDPDPYIEGGTASSLGALNAAHASRAALTHAAANSRVGRIATYEKVVRAENTLANPNATPAQKQAAQAYLNSLGLGQMSAQQAERTALARAANKPITQQVIDAVNDLLGL